MDGRDELMLDYWKEAFLKYARHLQGCAKFSSQARWVGGGKLKAPCNCGYEGVRRIGNLTEPVAKVRVMPS